MIEPARKLLESLSNVTSSGILFWNMQEEGHYVCVIGSNTVEIVLERNEDNQEMLTFIIKENDDILFTVHRTKDIEEDYRLIHTLYKIVKEHVIK